MRIAALVFVLTLVAGQSAVAAAPASSSRDSAFRLMTSALAVAERSGSVRFVDKSTSGTSTQTVNGAISAPSAEEIVSGTSPTFSVELIGTTVYVNGAASSIQNALGITAAQAAPVANKWIAVASTDAPFSQLTQALTLISELDEFTPTGNNVHLGKMRRLGTHKVIPIIGAPPSNTTKGVTGGAALFVSASSPHYPLGGTLVLVHGGKKLNEVAAFSNWGSTVHLTPPSGAVPFQSVLGG